VKGLFRRGDKAFRSASYWAERYRAGGTSGAGSAGVLAAYKAAHVNGLVARLGLDSVIEFGSGDGNQAALFDFSGYTGVDVVPQVVEAARRRFVDRSGWRFLTAEDYAAAPVTADMVMSLDVIYHLVEDDVFEASMRTLVGAAGRYLLGYASDHDSEARARHVRHRSYSRWLETEAPEFQAVETWENPNAWTEGADPEATSFAFFRLYERRGAGG
jgi:SAM-dependent methyltransferase